MAKPNQNEVDQVRADYEQMIAAVMRARTNRKFIQDMIVDPRVSHILGRYERDIEDKKESLVCCEKKDVDRNQAEVQARRQLLATFKGAYEADVEEATRALNEFKKSHELLLASIVPQSEIKAAV